LYIIFQAKETGVQIITIANDILDKLSNVGNDLVEFSLETVKMFRNDAVKAGFAIGK
jgi:transaldolase